MYATITFFLFLHSTQLFQFIFLSLQFLSDLSKLIYADQLQYFIRVILYLKVIKNQTNLKIIIVITNKHQMTTKQLPSRSV